MISKRRLMMASIKRGINWLMHSSSTGGKLTEEEETIRIEATGVRNSTVHVYLARKIDFTEYDTLSINVTKYYENRDTGAAAFYVGDNIGGDKYLIRQPVTTSGVITLNIRNITGFHYIYFTVYALNITDSTVVISEKAINLK